VRPIAMIAAAMPSIRWLLLACISHGNRCIGALNRA
jgi:hypothetical protein